MNVSLPAELATFVEQLVATGAFPNKEAVVTEALRRMRDSQANFEALKASIDDAVAELDRTGGTPLDFSEIKRKGRELLARNRK
jgi:putative addiction module CopG family antidote